MRFWVGSVLIYAIDGSTSATSSRKRVRVAEPSISTEDGFMDDWEFPMQVAIGYEITRVTANGRFVEQYDTEQVSATYGNDTMRIVGAQQLFDDRNDGLIPSDIQTKIPTPSGEFSLGTKIAHCTQSTIYTLADLPDVLVKFQANCEEIRENFVVGDAVVHPLIFDKWYGSEATVEGIAMAPFYLSPPFALCPSQSGVCAFRGMNETEYNQCRSAGGSIRYMLMNRSNGQSLGTVAKKMPKQRLPFHLAMDVGVSMMNLLETLHRKARLVHGDIHEDNILLDPVGENRYELKLIDFGRASHVEDRWPETPRLVDSGYSHYMYTQWMIDGHYWTQRDDVMKTVQMLAQLMHNSYLYRNIEEHYMQSGYVAQKGFKMLANLFSVGFPWSRIYRLDAVEELSIPKDKKGEIKKKLAHVLATVRGLNSTNSVIPYSELRDSFQRCSELAKFLNTTTN